MSDITVRALTEGDWQDFRAMRLLALQMHPAYFLWKYEECVSKPEAFWREHISRPERCIYGLYDGKKVIGITGVFKHLDFPDGKTADFGMTFIIPEYRGRKLSRLLYYPRIEWARENGFERIHISHHANNINSKNANQHFGFTYVGENMRDWPDGTRALDVEYELKL